MASMSLKDNSNKIVDTNMKIDFQSEEVNVYVNQLKTKYKYRLDYYSVPSRVLLISLFVEGLSHYIATHGSSWSSTCLSSELLLKYLSR